MQQYLIKASPGTTRWLRDHGILCLERVIGSHKYSAFLSYQKAEVLRALNWPEDEVIALPTAEVTSWILTLRSSVDWDTVFDSREAVTTPWRRYLDTVAQWCEQQRAHFPFPVTFHSGSHRLYTAFEPGRLHLCFGGGKASYHHNATVDDRWLRYQQSHLWLGELGPEHDSSYTVMTEVLERYVPRCLGTPWCDIAEYNPWITGEEVRRLRRKPYFQTGKVSEGGPQLVITTSQRALITHESRAYDVGEVQISIPLDHARFADQIRVRYHSNHRGMHPHVHPGGDVCWGTCHQDIEAYLKTRQYAALLDLIWMFLNTCAGSHRQRLPNMELPCYS